MTDGTLGASFRDPSGFVFERDGVLYRPVNRSYAADYTEKGPPGSHTDNSASIFWLRSR